MACKRQTVASFPGLHTQLLSLAVQKAGGRPGRSHHVIRAATDSVNTYSQYSTCYCLFQRHFRDQTNSRGEAGPTYTTYLDLKQNRCCTYHVTRSTRPSPAFCTEATKSGRGGLGMRLPDCPT